MAHLPEELISEILLQLPVNSLRRFRSVSKYWNSFISHPDFAQSHLTRYPRKDEYLILNNSTNENGKYTISVMSRNNLTETRINKLPCSISTQCKSIRLIGSINGLVCIVLLFDSRYHFILWNPVISRFKKILPPTRFCNTLQPSHTYLFAFGWDFLLNDYKLIVKVPNSLQCIVYSSNQDSWSEIFLSDDYLIWDGYESKVPSTIVKGCPYWSGSRSRQSIFKFEIKSNDFRLFQFPPETNQLFYQLFNLNDCLACVESRGSINGGQYYTDLYCFNDECEVWTKMYTISLRNSCSPLMCFKYGGDIVLTKKRRLYDHKSKQIKRIDCDDKGNFINGFSHTPSLILVEGMEKLQ